MSEDMNLDETVAERVMQARGKLNLEMSGRDTLKEYAKLTDGLRRTALRKGRSEAEIARLWSPLYAVKLLSLLHKRRLMAAMLSDCSSLARSGHACPEGPFDLLCELFGELSEAHADAEKYLVDLRNMFITGVWLPVRGPASQNRLTQESIADIRKCLDQKSATPTELAARHGCHPSTIRRLRARLATANPGTTVGHALGAGVQS